MKSALLVSFITLTLFACTFFLFQKNNSSHSSHEHDHSPQMEAPSHLSELGVEPILLQAQKDPAAAIAALKNFIETNPSYMNQCHEIAHEIGHIAYENFDENAFTFKDPFCGGGYLHGLLEAATIFDESMSLKDIVHTVCSGEIEESCLHGLGHAIYQSVESVPTAISYCDMIRSKNKDCYDGVFMELFDIDAPLEKIATKEALQICDESPLETKPSCIFYLPRILKHSDPAEAVALCNSMEESADRLTCAQGTGVMLMKYAPTFELDVTANTCSLYKETDLKEVCVTGVKDYFSYGNVTNTEW
jgi:hypothetical protein